MIHLKSFSVMMVLIGSCGCSGQSRDERFISDLKQRLSNKVWSEISGHIDDIPLEYGEVPDITTTAKVTEGTNVFTIKCSVVLPKNNSYVWGTWENGPPNLNKFSLSVSTTTGQVDDTYMAVLDSYRHVVRGHCLALASASRQTAASHGISKRK